MADRSDTVRRPERSGRGALLVARLGLAIVLIVGLILSLANPISVVAFVPSAGVGALLIIRRPTNPIGWLLLMFALGASFVARGRSIDLSAAELATSGVPLLTGLELLVQSVFSTSGILIPIALIAVVFPTGGWPRRRSSRIRPPASGSCWRRPSCRSWPRRSLP